MPRKSKAKKRRSEAEEESSDQGSNAEEQRMWAYMPFMSSPNRTQHGTSGGGESSATPYMAFQPAPREKKVSKSVTVAWELSAAIQDKILCSVKETDSISVEDFVHKFLSSVAPDCYFSELLSPRGGSNKSKVAIDLSLGPQQCIRIANTNEDVNTEDVKHYMYRIGFKSTRGVLQPSDTLCDLISDRHEEFAIVKLEGSSWGFIGTKGHDTIQTRLVQPTSLTTPKATKKTAEKSPTKAASAKKIAAKKKVASPKSNNKKPKGAEMDKEEEAGSNAGEQTKVVAEKKSANGKKRKAADIEMIEVEGAKSNKKSKKAKKDPNAPKRPISSYLFFVMDTRPEVVAENPEAKFTEVTKMLGARWQELSAKKRKKYEKLSKADHKRFDAEKAAYDAKVAKEAAEGNKDSDDDAEPMETETDDEEDDDSVNVDEKKADDTEVIAVEAAKSNKKPKKAKKAKKDPNAPKGPTSSYFYFAQDTRPEVVAENPEAKFTEVSKMLGAMWREIDGKKKMKYEKKAKADRERYEAEKAAYDAKVAELSNKVRVKKNAAKKRASEYKPEQDVGDSMDFDAEPLETNETYDDDTPPSTLKGKKRAKKAKQSKKAKAISL
mmetsp:Transcript_27051/g.65637  ORF Transcript_27051/g.65637 Transcript_27051/m.65637 type:complete len:607 (-) Transcript_27051:501-2321(-)